MTMMKRMGMARMTRRMTRRTRMTRMMWMLMMLVWHLLHLPGNLITVNVWLFGVGPKIIMSHC